MKSGPEDIDASMETEVKQAAEFLTKLVTKPQTQPALISQLRSKLVLALCHRYKNHWFVDHPERGQAYRAVEISKGRQFYDSMLLVVAENLGFSKSDLRLPYDICIWVDPGEVAVRFGDELGAFLPVWSKGNDGAMISYIDKFDFARLCERPSFRQVTYTPNNSYKSQSSKTNNSNNGEGHRLFMDRVSSDNEGSFVLDESEFSPLEYDNGNTPGKAAHLTNGNCEGSPAKASAKLRIANRNR